MPWNIVSVPAVARVALEDRLDLGSEEHPVADLRPVKRFDAQPIADEEQPPARSVPEPECKHAAEPLHALVAPLLVGVDDGLGV
jgi:hypothetical protein